VAVAAGKYDALKRRASIRRGRERGCWLYVPMEELLKTGVDVTDAPPHYRVWGGARGRLVVQLYKTD